MSIYKACDIRGDSKSELNPELFRIWGEVLGLLQPAGSMFFVGGDVRTTTEAFRLSLIDGLATAGMRVFDLGTVPTPMVHFAQRHLGGTACAIVTASHSPANDNGLKWFSAGHPPDEGQVGLLRAAGKDQGSGGEAAAGVARAAGVCEEADVDADYADWLVQRLGMAERLTQLGEVVVDPGNGCWAGRCGPILERLFPETRIHLIHDRPDGTFPERNPDCARPEFLGDLAAAVGARGADLGIAFDGDGDRVAFVDETGTPLTGEQATWILLQTMVEELPGQSMVYDVKMSDVVADAARELGARPHVERSGHAFIRTRMIDLDAHFGAELSGHYFHRELAGGDDGLFTACRMITFLAAGDRSLADLRQACPDIFVTPDLRLRVRQDDQDGVIAQVRSRFDEYPQSLIDGVRIEFESGWGLIRKSVTEEALTCRFEGVDEAALDEVVAAFSAGLCNYGKDLRQQYEERCDRS